MIYDYIHCTVIVSSLTHDMTSYTADLTSFTLDLT